MKHNFLLWGCKGVSLETSFLAFFFAFFCALQTPGDSTLVMCRNKATDQDKKNDTINRDIRKAQRELEREVKLLLLGEFQFSL